MSGDNSSSEATKSSGIIGISIPARIFVRTALQSRPTSESCGSDGSGDPSAQILLPIKLDKINTRSSAHWLIWTALREGPSPWGGSQVLHYADKNGIGIEPEIVPRHVYIISACSIHLFHAITEVGAADMEGHVIPHRWYRLWRRRCRRHRRQCRTHRGWVPYRVRVSLQSRKPRLNRLTISASW